MKKEIAIGAMLLLPLIAAAGDFTPLGLKPGLWESTVVTKMSGSPMANFSAEQRAKMDAAMANMPPDQRAKMEAMMGGTGRPTVAKYCMTKEALSRAIDFGANDARRHCQYNVVSSSATKQQANIECASEHGKFIGNMTFEALSPESGRVTMQMSQDGGMKMEITVNSRYLGADCGDVKPR